MKNLKEKSLELHKINKGKIAIHSKVRVENKEDLSLAYSPGVAFPCLEIKNDDEKKYEYTNLSNTVAVISDGTAVLGLGDIGPTASLPVMEGKCILFKEFADIDAFPIVLNTKDTEEIINTIKLIASSFGGINLEDIKAPKCIEIEKRLKQELNIPVFHDDQHGTAIITTAAIINSCRLSNKKVTDLEVVLCGVGAAGSSIARMLKGLGVKKVYGYNSSGVICENKYDRYDFSIKDLLKDKILDCPDSNVDLKELMIGKDVFIGVSVANIVTKEMISSMNKDPFVFAMANPNPEIPYEDAKEAGAFIVGTGRSDYPNQVNNVLAFPGIFRGVLDAKKQNITMEMKFAAANAIADILLIDELTPDYIIPSPFDKRVVHAVSEAVKKCK